VAPVSRQPTLHKDPFSIEASVLSEYLLIITQINYVYTGQMARSALYVIQLPVYFLVCLTARFLSGVTWPPLCTVNSTARADPNDLARR
jgi:hypothetical protein